MFVHIKNRACGVEDYFMAPHKEKSLKSE